MKRIVFAVIALLAFAVLYIARIALGTPSAEGLALPAPLISVRDATGQLLLNTSRYRGDHELLAPNFVAQARRAFCGVASTVTVVNSLRHPQPPLTQASAFDVEPSPLRASLAVSVKGLTLEQLAGLLRDNGQTVTMSYASNTSLERFRQLATQTLNDKADVLVINYDRAVLKQEGAGHISPIAAYHEATDHFLVLDVAAHKYPPTWVPGSELWKSMETIDPDSGKSRGFLLVR